MAVNPLVFDCWASYGPRPNADSEERWTLRDLLEDLDFYGVAGALVRHERFAYYDLMWSNREMMKEIAPHRDRLFPCWAAMPAHAGDFPEPSEFVREIEGENVGAVYMSPATCQFPTQRDVLGPLAQELNRHKVVILTMLAELHGDYESAVRFCNAFCDCPVVIAGAGWGDWRTMTALMDACANAHVEFHLFQANRAVEYFAERYGAERVLLGSGLLAHSAGAARGFVDWSLMDDDSVSRFAGRNLVTLLRTGPDSAPPVPVGADEIVEAGRAGQKCPVLTLDAHCHVLHEGLDGAGKRYVMLKGDCRHMLALTRRMGVDVTAMMSWIGPIGMDVDAGNALVEQVVEEFGDEVIGLSTCNPARQSPDDVRGICERFHLGAGFRGMKPYHTAGLSYADPAYAPWWEFCNEHRLYGLLHVSENAGGYEAVGQLADRYAEATFIIAHVGGDWKHARNAVEVIRKHPNVMAELTLTPVLNGIVEWLCAQAGPDRIMFGTDAPMRDPRPQLGWCVYTRLGLSEKRKVLGENFARVLKRGRLPGHRLPEVIEKSGP